MRTTKATPWIAGTVVLSVLVLVASWFLLVSPVVAQAAETNQTAEQTEHDNVLLQQRIATLKEEFANIETYRAELASLRTAVPSDADIAGYLRQIDALALAHGVSVLTVTPQPPTPFAPAAAVEQPAADAAVTDDAAAEAAPAAPAEAPTGAPAGMEAIPLNLTVVGTFQGARAFLADLQTGTQRLLLVESVSGSSLTDGEAGGGRPATTIGDLELTISAFLFSLPAPTTGVPAEAPAEQPLPTLPEGRNPLVPLG